MNMPRQRRVIHASPTDARIRALERKVGTLWTLFVIVAIIAIIHTGAFVLEVVADAKQKVQRESAR